MFFGLADGKECEEKAKSEGKKQRTRKGEEGEGKKTRKRKRSSEKKREKGPTGNVPMRQPTAGPSFRRN